MESIGALSLSHLIVDWTAFAVVASLSTLRYSLRRSHNGRLQLDDWIHVAALIQCFIHTILVSITHYYDVEQAITGGWTLPLNRLSYYVDPIESCFFWSTIFTVKAYFLVFYLRIFGVSRQFIFFWRIAVVVVAAAFIIVIFSNFLFCGKTLTDYNFYNCQIANIDDDVEEFIETRVVVMSVIPNAITDLILMVLPIGMLLQLHTSRARKLRIIPIFMLSGVTIIIDVLAWVLIYGPIPASNLGALFAGNVFYDLEPMSAVVIAALPVVLFTDRANSRHSSGEGKLLPQHAPP